ncbi:ABC-type cobalt transport system, permease component CbiQ [Desulfitobacterium dehalogenans ATCC 51507]|uniref:ABC-type cobalt transport system, permease component CbiQ n=1 Tax=Desulfitobacterium dehalogenans (strain ATCC 51507 / DSM 9161 / JW/IU-DC1) TaxID=756499 RepID=I4A7K8_DESDJ|nr:energy-coupling factor transporter transmembrane component T [Desulfitobacterium dehalogenans]AFL99942.1 ABC-type cobalt transport system, permease component CbiQ [Desulfitobacterium dehalogenans ATCC 51507]
MSKIVDSIYNVRLLDDLARKDTSIHRIPPVIKILTTIVYLIVVVSFDRYEISGLLPFVFYPMILILLAELPAKPIFKRLLMVEPLIIGIGILNPLFDPRGWITFVSIMIKCGLTVTVSLILVATTGMERIAQALRALKVPSVFVLQLLLTFRYISVLMEELARMMRAYSLRAPGQKGIRLKDCGSFAGQLLLRTFDRAQRVYDSMRLRGFEGEYPMGCQSKILFKDSIYLGAWSLFFIIARVYDIPVMIGSLFGR